MDLLKRSQRHSLLRKNHKNKRGIELAVNFLVMLMLGIVIFAFGIRFAYKLFAQGNELTSDAYKQYSKQIEGLACASAEKVCLPTKTLTIDGTKPAIFGVVIENVLTSEQTFNVKVTPTNFVAKGSPGRSVAFQAGEEDDKIQFLPKPTDPLSTITLQSKEKQSVGIVIQANGAEAGTYSFTVEVLREGSSYTTTPFKIYVKVP